MRNDQSFFAIPLISTGLLRVRRRLELFLGCNVKFGFFCLGRARGIIGWGRRPSGMRSQFFARIFRSDCYLLEDGFVRSVDSGSRELPYSLVVDNVGIYYDATTASFLENLIAKEFCSSELVRVNNILNIWKKSRVSKYNYLREYIEPLPDSFVLVVDQTFGDASISYGLADATSFERMLSAAISENPNSYIVIKTHPDVFLGKKRGHFNLTSFSENKKIIIIGDSCHPVNLISKADAIYVVTSQIGFEGLLYGKMVRTFGMPFYAGWGLTKDELSSPVRRNPISLERLVFATLVEYSRYIDPESLELCTPERFIEWMGLQRQMRERFPKFIYAVGFSDWKRPIIRDFFQGSHIEFVDCLQKVPTGKGVIVWGVRSLKPVISGFGRDIQSSAPMHLEERDIIRVEDGFLRSVGLGADLIRPLSWVMDTSGIYYDATRPSDLEKILQNNVFDTAILARASALRERIVSSRVTKYNVGSNRWQRPNGVSKVILVPGQVETDASIAYGAPEGVCSVRRNMELLQAVRVANPQAYVVYKPHPDVLAGLRLKGLDEDLALHWCDELVVDCSMGELLDAVDEVHVITSLAGFEALLRRKKVFCYGQPFYSSWGLTTDIVPVSRRTRRLSLDELIAGALILYPTYLSRTTGRFTTPERALDELLIWRERGGTTLPLWRRFKRMVLRLYKR